MAGPCPAESGKQGLLRPKFPSPMIATSAFGSPMRCKIDVLRSFRDRCLLTSGAGRAFVRSYNRYGPDVADWIGRHGWAKPVVRSLLLPLVGLAYLLD